MIFEDQIFGLLIRQDIQDQGLAVLLKSLLHSCKIIGNGIREGKFLHDEVGTNNVFGDSQLHVDIESDAVIFHNLRVSGLVHVASSEENPSEVACGYNPDKGPGFSVAFDPLDGSSIIDANFAVGTIIGIYCGNGLLNRTGLEQAASMLVQYGPRVTAVIALNEFVTANGKKVCIELTMNSEGWIVTKDKLTIAPRANTFAPGNLRATSDNIAYQNLVNYWISNKYTLRYSGGLVPDIYHIFAKGQGVFSNASSKSAKAKLRLLFECAPIALLIEAAGGQSIIASSENMQVVAPISVLSVPIDDLDKRVGMCVGSADEVDRFKSFIYN